MHTRWEQYLHAGPRTDIYSDFSGDREAAAARQASDSIGYMKPDALGKMCREPGSPLGAPTG